MIKASNNMIFFADRAAAVKTIETIMSDNRLGLADLLFGLAIYADSTRRLVGNDELRKHYEKVTNSIAVAYKTLVGFDLAKDIDKAMGL